MNKYTVIKRLVLEIEVEAEDEDDAVAAATEYCDQDFDVLDCQYEVEISRT